MRLVVTAQARSDIKRLLVTMGRVNPAAAGRLGDRLDRSIAQLIDFPGIGTIRDDLRNGLRMIVVSPYLVFYRLAENETVIVRVVHGHRDLQRIFHKSSR